MGGIKSHGARFSFSPVFSVPLIILMRKPGLGTSGFLLSLLTLAKREEQA